MQIVRIDLEERASQRSLIARFLARIDETEGGQVPDVEVRAAEPREPLFAVLDLCRSKGIGNVRVRLGPRGLDGDMLRQLAPWRDRLRVEIGLTTFPGERGATPRAWTLSALTDALAALDSVEVDVGVNYRVSTETVGGLSTLMELAEGVAAGGHGPLHVAIPSVKHARERDEVPVSFSRLAPLLKLAGEKRRLLRIRSGDGTPLCLFSGDLPDALVRSSQSGSSSRPSLSKATFGPQCGSCVLRASCSGVSIPYARCFGTDELTPVGPSDSGAVATEPAGGPAPLGWADRARLLLIDQPQRRLLLKDLVPASEMPPWPCILPWRRLEIGWSGEYGPCCPDYLVERQTAPVGTDLQELWNRESLQATRRAMSAGGHPVTCRRSCPVLASGSQRAEELPMQGGTAELVENQIQVVEDMIAGRAEVRSPPLDLCVAVTSFCNYDCVMCSVPRGGPHDELGTGFYRGLEPWLDKLMLFDANGGEPLASPTFRAFLERADFERYRQLQLHITTNGSYLNPSRLDGWAALPLSSLTVSLNATTPATYRTVNRGLPWDRIRANLDALLTARHEGRIATTIRYSMVLLRSNLDEVVSFADLAMRDGVGVRYLLPTSNRNDESIMTDPDLVLEAHRALREVCERWSGPEDGQDSHELAGIVSVLESRLASGTFEVL